MSPVESVGIVHAQLATCGWAASMPLIVRGAPTDLHGLSAGRFGVIVPVAPNWPQNGKALPWDVDAASDGTPADALQ